MSVIWQTKIKVVETDFETHRRQQRLKDHQQVDWFVAATWGVVGLICLTWARILWLWIAIPLLGWMR